MILRRRTARKSGPGANCIINYTSNDGNVIQFSSDCCSPAILLSNTYSNGQGTLVFDRDVVNMYNFTGKSMLSTITCPSSVNNVASSAFANCTSLNTINFSNSSDSLYLSTSAFRNCSNLTTVNLSSFTGSLYIGAYAFIGCYSMTSFSASNCTTYSIGSYAFKDCTMLSTVNLSINSSASFSNVEGIFSGCASLTRFNVDAAHRSSDYYIFSSGGVILGIAAAGITSSYCNTVVGYNCYVVPNADANSITYTTVGSHACEKCFTLSSNTCKGILFTNNINNINIYAFSENLYLYVVRFAYNTSYSNMTSIAGYSFYKCTNLIYVYNLDYVKNFGLAAFAYDTNLTYQRTSSTQSTFSTTGSPNTLYLGNTGGTTFSYPLYLDVGTFFNCSNVKYVYIGATPGNTSKSCYISGLYVDTFSKCAILTFQLGQACTASSLTSSSSLDDYVFYQNMPSMKIYIYTNAAATARTQICNNFKNSTQDEEQYAIYNSSSFFGYTTSGHRDESPSY